MLSELNKNGFLPCLCFCVPVHLFLLLFSLTGTLHIKKCSLNVSHSVKNLFLFVTPLQMFYCHPN